MSDTVKLIIEIPKEVKQAFDKAESNDLKGGYYDHGGVIGKAIQNGTPLPKGHWIEENINEWSRKVFCSECGCPPPFEYVSNGDVYSASGYGVINKTKFCPNCGADMRGE